MKYTWFSRAGSLVSLLVCAFAAPSVDAAFPNQITFSELSERPLDGVSLKGVTFHFTGSNSDFPQGLFGTMSLSYGGTSLMSAPWAAGSSVGTLKLDFASPVSGLSFDAGLTTTAPLTIGFRVDLFRGTELIDSIGVPTRTYGPSPFQFSEAEFTYIAPGVPLTSATVTFAPGLNFVLDNLGFAVVPEPGTVTLSLAGLIAILLARRRR